MKTSRFGLSSLALLIGLAAAGQALALEGRVAATGFTEPVFVAAPPGDSRVFVVEKRGVIHVVAGGVRKVFLDLSSRVAGDGERGLLGLAFDPGYASNGRFYVDFIEKNSLNTVVASFRRSAANPDRADPRTGRLILRFAQGPFDNHKAGWIGFRPGDGKNLYVATGDGGSGYDPDNNAQDGQVLLGKMLRLDVSAASGGYQIPADNPFVGSPEVRPEIWALGLRNPFRPSFDRANGNFWIADVGQDTREELNFEPQGDPGGHNYGWRLREGTRPTPIVGGNAPGLTGPVFDYPHSGSASLGSAITGGYLYRGPSLPEADGRYFFGDFVSGRAYSMAATAGGVVSDLRDETSALLGGTGLQGLGSFGEDSLGRLYAIGLNGVIVVMCPSGSAERAAAAPPAAVAADPCLASAK
ncbi:MAG TPA: PQQ-dependent sugar dehydrogenase [Ideonella sp.]|nr:PQQ-dependent sugar dehydrogenase [Ideonella sp.]